MWGKYTSPTDGMGMKHQNPMHMFYWSVGFLDGPFSTAFGGFNLLQRIFRFSLKKQLSNEKVVSVLNGITLYPIMWGLKCTLINHHKDPY